jgi:hypothetical protein
VSVVMVGSAPRPFIGARRRGAAGGGGETAGSNGLNAIEGEKYAMPCYTNLGKIN